MRRSNGRVCVSAAALVATAGTCMASLSIGPTNVITWGVTGGGRSLAALQPAGTTWSFFNAGTGLPGNPVIDGNGRVYFQSSYLSSAGLGTPNSSTNRGIFTATNSTDMSVFNGIYDTGTWGGYNLKNTAGTVGGVSTTPPRVSGSKVAFGLQISGGSPAIVETGTGVNNSVFAIGDYAGGVAIGAQQNDSVTLNDTSGSAVSVGHNTALKSISQQNSGINAAGTALMWMSVPAVTGSFVTTQNATAAPFGNTGFLATKTVGGGYTVVAQGGQSAPGVAGGRFQNGSNGVNGFFAKLNRSGQVAFDAKLCTNFPVTTSSDQAAYIYTPGSGSTLVYREGQPIKDAFGNPDAGGALWGNATAGSGGVVTANKCFSNAGMLFYATSIGGDTITTPGATQNDSALYLATASSTSRVIRRGDALPSLGAGVRLGSVNVSGSAMGINNSGFMAFGATLQGNVTAKVNPQFTAVSPPQIPTIVTTGVMGNDQVIMAGTAGNLQAIARNGDLVPGSDWRFNFDIAAAGICLNNNGDVLFSADTTRYNVGDAIGVVGQPATSILPFGPTVLMGWSAAYGLLPLLSTGQSVEVDPGVFKTIVQYSVISADNGDGGCVGLNDNGTFVARLTFADNSWSVVTLQIPAPGTGALALLGLGAMARRRRN